MVLYRYGSLGIYVSVSVVLIAIVRTGIVLSRNTIRDILSFNKRKERVDPRLPCLAFICSISAFGTSTFSCLDMVIK